MLATLLLMRNRRVLAGILLGIALSKYSLAMSIFLFLLLNREYLILIISLGVQMLGVIIISFWGTHTPLLTLNHYWQMIIHHSSLPGTHLASLFAANSQLAFIITFFMTVALLRYLWRIDYRSKSRNRPWCTVPNRHDGFTMTELHILSILLLWSLLVVYHRAYDTLIVIVFIAVLIYGLSSANIWTITWEKRLGLKIFLAIFVTIMSIPATIMSIVLPADFMPAWYQIVSYATTAILIAGICTASWLVNHIIPQVLIDENQST